MTHDKLMNDQVSLASKVNANIANGTKGVIIQVDEVPVGNICECIDGEEGIDLNIAAKDKGTTSNFVTEG